MFSTFFKRKDSQAADICDECQQVGTHNDSCADAPVAAAPEPPKNDDIKTDFAATSVGKGEGCKSFTNLSIDIVEQNDGVWLARCSNWSVFAHGATDEQALMILWTYIRDQTLAKNR